MLSRKRCRGTLQDYNKGEISAAYSQHGGEYMENTGDQPYNN